MGSVPTKPQREREPHRGAAPGADGTDAARRVGPTREGRALQDALRAAIVTRRGSGPWTVDHAGWVVTLHSPEEHDFSGTALEEALTWCLVWLMAKGIPGDWGLGTGHPKGLDRGPELGSRLFHV